MLVTCPVKTAVSPYTRILGRLTLVIAEWVNSPDSTSERNWSLAETPDAETMTPSSAMKPPIRVASLETMASAQSFARVMSRVWTGSPSGPFQGAAMSPIVRIQCGMLAASVCHADDRPLRSVRKLGTRRRSHAPLVHPQ